jgi:hypothetical protein
MTLVATHPSTFLRIHRGLRHADLKDAKALLDELNK